MLFRGGSAVLAQTEGSKPGDAQQCALLIGVEKYVKAHPLQFTVNDVEQLARTLETRGGMAKTRILRITDNAVGFQHQPSKTNLQSALPKWLKQVGPNDQILVYFSGHGFRDKEGKLYLAPIDIDPANPADTGVPVEWFREQITACPAAFKLLVIDACHAGSEKGVLEDGVTSKELGDKFEGLEKVVTLASSSASEKSQIWDDRQQSLFSYWLNQGQKGHADENGNGAIDFHELYGYVSRTVKQTAQTRLWYEQTPRQIVHAGIDGVPIVLTLRPQTLKVVLGDIAEQLAFAVEEHQLSLPDTDRKFPKVGVIEFLNDTHTGESLGGAYGLLGRNCRDEVERQMNELKMGRFDVADGKKVQKALSDEQFTISDLGETAALKELSAKADGMTYVATGTLRNRVGQVITLQCKVEMSGSNVVVGSAGGKAIIDEHEWASLGHSVAVRPEDRPASAPATPDRPVVGANEQFIQRLDQLAQGPHPLLDPNFKFRVWLEVGTVDTNGPFKERKPEFRGSDCFVPVHKREVLHIHVENNSGQLALMRLLVDGLNTLPEKITTTVIENGQAKGVVTSQWGQRVDLGDARHWLLDPNGEELKKKAPKEELMKKAPNWVISGFATETGENSEMRQFVVVDADKSLAMRQQFTEQLGLITAAFYAPASTGRGPLGIAPGPAIIQNLKERKSPPIGKLLGVVHLRYVDAAALANAAGKAAAGK